ncbi:hypothetical protein CALVIDRAFT_72927 [Calocera viscosa TUFC12733]|uniref:WD40 repeat-like protein n=1 Tax=Calocera viscosa (strain TUFC12733) TaxID=1330018 RepID=A0A167NC31_CALVF|nr:hypothetical protein CALVIDRAFT_72927 [Calocera viscosa TUFC12733]
MVSSSPMWLVSSVLHAPGCNTFRALHRRGKQQSAGIAISHPPAVSADCRGKRKRLKRSSSALLLPGLSRAFCWLLCYASHSHDWTIRLWTIDGSSYFAITNQ